MTRPSPTGDGPCIDSRSSRNELAERLALALGELRERAYYALQHWMGHADSKTTQIYAHYQASDQEADAVDRAFT